MRLAETFPTPPSDSTLAPRRSASASAEKGAKNRTRSRANNGRAANCRSDLRAAHSWSVLNSYGPI